MTELKPCPFCGGKAKWDKDWQAVVCTNCGASTRCSILVTRKKKEAVEAWNRRAEIKGKEGKISPNWHTGTPTEEGEYLVCRVPEAGHLFRFNQLCIFGDLMGSLDHKIFYIGEPGKDSFENITASVIAWQRIEPLREESNG